MTEEKRILVDALMSGCSTVTVSDVEFRLKPLKRDTLKNREREANKRADELLKFLK